MIKSSCSAMRLCISYLWSLRGKRNADVAKGNGGGVLRGKGWLGPRGQAVRRERGRGTDTKGCCCLLGHSYSHVYIGFC